MKIAHLVLRDFLCYAEADLDLGAARLVVLAGPNESGKSALVDAVRWAFLGRGRLGGARDDTVRRGAKTCRVDVQVAGGPEVTRTPSRGSHTLEALATALGVRDKAALEAALDVGFFLALAPAERRRLAFRLAGGEVTAAILAEHRITDPELQRLTLDRGFAAAEKRAADEKRRLNREADERERGAPADADVALGENVYRLSALSPQAVQSRIALLRGERDKAREALAAGAGADEATRAAVQAEVDRAEREAGEMRAKAGPLLAARETGEQAEREALAVGKPEAEKRRLGLQVARREAEKLRVEITRASGAAALATARIAEAKKALARAETTPLCATRCVSHCPPDRDYALARARSDLQMREKEAGEAAAEVDRIKQSGEAAEQKVVALAAETQQAEQAFLPLAQAASEARRQHEQAARIAEDAEARLRGARNRLAALRLALPEEEAARLRAELTDREARIARGEEIAGLVTAYHAGERSRREATALRASASGWEAQEYLLRPNGAMAALVAGPLARLREVLGRVAPRFLAAPLALADDWTLSYDGAPWEYASTSARWRIGAACALALASLSGLRWVALDEASICVGSARDALSKALLAETGDGGSVDQVWLCTSRGEGEEIKAPPLHMAGAVRVFRVAGGMVHLAGTEVVTA